MLSALSRGIGRLAINTSYGPFIGGKSLIGDGATIPLLNPATGQEISSIKSPSTQQVHDAISKAQSVYESGEWSRASQYHRAKVLSRLSILLSNHLPDLAVMETLQTGRTLREMNAQLGRLPEWIDYYVSLLRTQGGFVAPTQGPLLNYVTRVPLGVVAQITPFNHPLLIAVKKIAPALAAGNSVIVKPSELAPASVLEFAQLAEEAGVPDGVLTILAGGPETARTLIGNRLLRKVDITAGTTTGRAIGSVVGANLASYTAELGGKAPVIVFDDADIASAVNGVAFAAFVASGQTCVSATRLILQDGIYDNFMSAFKAKVTSITERIGDPLNPKSTMGPVIHEQQRARILAMIQEASNNSREVFGGNVMTGLSKLDGFDLSKGSFISPAIISGVEVGDTIWQEEVFGPVLVVKRFKDEEDGIRLANDCKYGLGAGVWTSDIARGHRVAARIEAGIVWVNTHHRNDPSSPWGGMKESGIGRENGVEAFESYSQSRSTVVNIASYEQTRRTDDWFADDPVGKRYG